MNHIKLFEDFDFLPDQSLIKVDDEVQFISQAHIIDKAIPNMGTELADKTGKVVKVYTMKDEPVFDIKVEDVDTIIGVPDTIIDKI